MNTRDRIQLDADVYYPDAEGEFPVLLMRQPYGRTIASTVVYAHPIWYAAHGYIVVIQDVRGRGTSAGEFKLFEHEIEDGFDTVQWAANLPRSTGKVGMYGFSYQGMTQLYAAVNQPEALKAICPAMLAPDLYHDWAYENGAFCLFANLGWAIQLAAETARLKGDESAFLELSKASKSLPLSDRIPARPDVIQKFAHYDAYYQNWLDRASPADPYWQKLTPGAINIPALYIGGWFDTYLRGTLRSYLSAPQAHLIVGVWAHLLWGRKVGSIDYGADAVSFCDRAQIRWFDHFLKDADLTDSSVQLFEMGSNQWRSFSKFPKVEPTTLYLSSTGLAGMDDRDGRLNVQPSESAVDIAVDIIVHDPWRPVPALGGHVAYPCGSFDRRSIDARSDILTYTTEPLETDLQLVGESVLEVYASSDSPSFDLCAVLSEVKPNGSVMNFSQGYLSSDRSELTAHRIPLQSTCIQLPQGSAIRLSLSGACFPAYPVNAGTGTKPGETRAIDFQIVTINIHTETANPSRLLLPILK